MSSSDEYLDFGYTANLSLFQPPLVDTGIEKTKWVPYKSVSQMDRGLEFVVANNSSAYIDLSRTRLHLQVKVCLEDGSSLPVIPPGVEIPPNADVGPVNLFHSSLFQQVSLNDFVKM